MISLIKKKSHNPRRCNNQTACFIPPSKWPSFKTWRYSVKEKTKRINYEDSSIQNVYNLSFFLIHSPPSPPLFLLLPSGTLAPCSQTGVSHPRSGITIILQILNDLLRAACHHQGAPRTLSQLHCPASNPAVSQLLTAEEQNKANSQTLADQRTEHLGKTPGELHHSDLLITFSFDLFSAFMVFSCAHRPFELSF